MCSSRIRCPGESQARRRSSWTSRRIQHRKPVPCDSPQRCNTTCQIYAVLRLLNTLRLSRLLPRACSVPPVWSRMPKSILFRLSGRHLREYQANARPQRIPFDRPCRGNPPTIRIQRPRPRPRQMPRRVQSMWAGLINRLRRVHVSSSSRSRWRAAG